MSDIRQRTKELLEALKSEKKVTQGMLAELLGYKDQSNIAQIKRKGSFDVEQIDIMSNAYDVNSEWYFFNRGEMFKIKGTSQNINPTIYKGTQRDVITLSNSADEIQEFKQRIKEPIIIPVFESNKNPIAIIDAPAAAGLPANYDNPDFWHSLQYMHLPLPTLRAGQRILIRVEGRSMERKFQPGDWVLARYVDDVNDLKDGVYVVVSKDGTVLKKVLNRIEQRQALAMKSYNHAPEFYTYDLHIRDVFQVYKSEMVLKYDLGNEDEETTREILEDLVARVGKIEKKLKN